MSNPHHLTAKQIDSLPSALDVHPVNHEMRRTISSPGDTTGLTTLRVNDTGLSDD